MNEHPIESLAAFALGALDTNEAVGVAAHVLACPTCRAEVNEFREAIAHLPYQNRFRDPPARVKRQLFARIAAFQEQEAPPAQPAAPPAARPRTNRAWQAVSALAVVAALALGGVTMQTQQRMAELSGELTQTRQNVAALTDARAKDQASLTAAQSQIAGLQQQVALQSNRQKEAVSFIAAPMTVGKPMVAKQSGAEGKMYMQPGHSRVVLVIHGLNKLEKGKTYQFWLANTKGQVPSQTFTVGEDGVAELVIDAPQPVDDFAQVMVTVEDEGGSAHPSDTVVFEASIA